MRNVSRDFACCTTINIEIYYFALDEILNKNVCWQAENEFYGFLCTPCFWRRCNDKSYAHVHTKLQSVQLKYFSAKRRCLCGECWAFVKVVTASNDVAGGDCINRGAVVFCVSQHELIAMFTPLKKRLIEMSLSVRFAETICDDRNAWQHDDEALETGSVKELFGLHHQNW